MRKAPILLILVLSFHPTAASAQQSRSGTISLRGIVGTKVMISPSWLDASGASDSGITARLIRVSDERVILNLADASQSAGPAVIVRLLLRTNAAYEIRAHLSSSVNAPTIKASVESLRATGAGVVLMALESIQAQASPVNLSAAPAIMASGPRISRGPASLSTNAIEMELRFKVASGAAIPWSADVSLEIIPLVSGQ